jgi:hypothetical protein
MMNNGNLRYFYVPILMMILGGSALAARGGGHRGGGPHGGHSVHGGGAVRGTVSHSAPAVNRQPSVVSRPQAVAQLTNRVQPLSRNAMVSAPNLGRPSLATPGHASQLAASPMSLGSRPAAMTPGRPEPSGFAQRPIGGNLGLATRGSVAVNHLNTPTPRAARGDWNNAYASYHRGWVHGHTPAYGLGGGYEAQGSGAGGFGSGFGFGLGTVLGTGLGYGLASGLYNPMLGNWGYSNYSNPYYGGSTTVAVQEPAAYDYSRPIDPTGQPPSEAVASGALATFEQAREAFRIEDYATALDLTDKVLVGMPDDSTLHEFRALALFALGRYDEAAATLYAVLAATATWDWSTLIKLYSNPAAYTEQLRALEGYCAQNPRSTSGRLVLAYHYLTQEHVEASLAQLKVVVALEPKDQLSADLARWLERILTPPTDADVARTSISPPPDRSSPAPSVDRGKPEGTWTAHPDADTTIAVTFQDDGHFIWSVNRQGRDRRIEGSSSYAGGVLSMVQDPNSALIGNIHWRDLDHFDFKALGAGTSDKGLSFTRSS